MGWQKDRRMVAGGRWECREKRRVYNEARSIPWKRERRTAQQRHRYDTDWVYRIGRNLAASRRERLATLARRKQALMERG